MISLLINLIGALMVTYLLKVLHVNYYMLNGHYPHYYMKMWKRVKFYKVIHMLLVLYYFFALLSHSKILGILSLAITLIAFAILKSVSKSYRKSFIRDAYKIYKYINHQTESGVRFSDALTSSHNIIVSHTKSDVIHLFTEHTLLKQDIDEAKEILLGTYEREDVELFALIIEQELLYGSNHRRLIRYELMMYEKYKLYLSSLTQKIKQKMLKQSILMFLLFIIAIVFPMVSVALSGITNLMS